MAFAQAQVKSHPRLRAFPGRERICALNLPLISTRGPGSADSLLLGQSAGRHLIAGRASFKLLLSLSTFRFKLSRVTKFLKGLTARSSLRDFLNSKTSCLSLLSNYLDLTRVQLSPRSTCSSTEEDFD